MHPELTTALAALHSRELTAQATGNRALARQAGPPPPTASPGPASAWP
jgi:hypothetical protein